MDESKDGEARRELAGGDLGVLDVLPPSSCKVYTPDRLAKAMADSIFDSKSQSQNWLEPSSGQGVFVSALAALGISRNRITAVDLDTVVAESDALARVVRGEDFLHWSQRRHGRFSCVIGNPPYVAIGSLPESLERQAASVCGLDGTPIGVRANTWYAFTTEAIRCLKPGGNLAFVLPASCEYSDYAAVGRESLIEIFGRVDLIRSRRPLFEGVSEGSVVLIARDKGSEEKLYRRHVVDDIDGVIGRLKKLPKLNARRCPKGLNGIRQSRKVRLSAVMDIRLGGVTGDSKYFLMSESKRRERKIPKSALVPVVSRSRHIVSSNVSGKEWEKLRGDDEKVWLFRPIGRAVEHESVQRYLDLSESEGGCNQKGYKIKNRNPWYITPLPTGADAFITGMNANGLWLCLNDMEALSATNTLYVASFREDCTRQEKYSWAISLLTSVVAKQVSRSTRVYADGLTKLEPGQIAQLYIPTPQGVSSAVSTYKKICNMYLLGDKRGAIGLADATVLG